MISRGYGGMPFAIRDGVSSLTETLSARTAPRPRRGRSAALKRMEALATTMPGWDSH